MTYIVILMSFQTISPIKYALENIVNSYSVTWIQFSYMFKLN